MTWTLVYDGECPLCTAAAGWAMRKARQGSLELLPCRAPERAARFPHIAEETCLTAIQLISPEGRAHSGHEALPHLLAFMRGWRWVAPVLRVPGMAWLSARTYAWVAGHRHALSIIIRKSDVTH